MCVCVKKKKKVCFCPFQRVDCTLLRRTKQSSNFTGNEDFTTCKKVADPSEIKIELLQIISETPNRIGLLQAGGGRGGGSGRWIFFF